MSDGPEEPPIVVGAMKEKFTSLSVPSVVDLSTGNIQMSKHSLTGGYSVARFDFVSQQYGRWALFTALICSSHTRHVDVWGFLTTGKRP